MSAELEQLQGKLRRFAALDSFKDTPKREGRLPELVRFIRGFGEEEQLADGLAARLESDWQSSQPLKEAVKCATLTQFEIDGRRTLPWAGGYTVVALSRNGEITGLRNPVGLVYQEYGKNLYPYALTKALFRMHLNLAGRTGGLDKLENLSYLEGLGFRRGKELFLGEEQMGPGDQATYIGTSGCELTGIYVMGLLPESMRDRYTTEFVAGFADMVFARSVVSYLEFPDREGDPSPMHEPAFFSQLRIAH